MAAHTCQPKLCHGTVGNSTTAPTSKKARPHIEAYVVAAIGLRPFSATLPIRV